MGDRSKTGESGLSVPSDKSRDEDEEIPIPDNNVSQNEALGFLLIIVFLTIVVVWKINITTIVIGILAGLIFPFSAVHKARHSPIPEAKLENTSTEKMNSGPSKPPIVLLPLKEMSKNKTYMLRKCELGTRDPRKEDKVILVVGATGSGKTTLINDMVNYVLGVEWEDNERFKMIADKDEKELPTQAGSQTQWITAYTLHHESHFKIPFTLTIIDTPDFGDTRGIEHDNKTLRQISEFLYKKDAGGIDQMTAIGIVVPSSAAPLTHTQKFIFDAVLSLFGKDVVQNIIPMITFSDGQIPPVLDAITKAGIPHRKYFKFNNSALFAKSSVNNEDIDDDTGFYRMVWKNDSKSFEDFFVKIQKMKNISLQLTKNVLVERMSLETAVQEIRLQLEAGLNILGQYETEVNVLKKHKKDIELNKNFTYEVTVDTAVKVGIPNGLHTTTCLKCNFTCHASCAYGDDSDKFKCFSMLNGTCTVCPGKCNWQTHKNRSYHIIIKRETKTKTANDLKLRYEKAVKGKLTSQALIEQVSQDFAAVQINVIYLTDQIRKSLVRLDQIALRPNPMTAVEYIDIMIKSEKKEQKTGWNERVKQLEAIQAQAKIIYDLGDENFDPFAEYGESYEELMKQGGDRINALRKLQGKIKIRW